jgi:hypothetical protein
LGVEPFGNAGTDTLGIIANQTIAADRRDQRARVSALAQTCQRGVKQMIAEAAIAMRRCHAERPEHADVALACEAAQPRKPQAFRIERCKADRRARIARDDVRTRMRFRAPRTPERFVDPRERPIVGHNRRIDLDSREREAVVGSEPLVEIDDEVIQIAQDE